MENGVREVKKKRIAAFAALCGPRVKTQWPRIVGRPLWADSGPSAIAMQWQECAKERSFPDRMWP
jgi:hypothetical protein